MAKICSQKPPLAGGTLNICKSGTSKKALFWHISSILAMKGSQLWPLTHLKDKYYGKIELGKKIVKFGAPGTEIWLFKKKNMDRSIDCAVDHILHIFLIQIPPIGPTHCGYSRYKLNQGTEQWQHRREGVSCPWFISNLPTPPSIWYSSNWSNWSNWRRPMTERFKELLKPAGSRVLSSCPWPGKHLGGCTEWPLGK